MERVADGRTGGRVGWMDGRVVCVDGEVGGSEEGGEKENSRI